MSGSNPNASSTPVLRMYGASPVVLILALSAAAFSNIGLLLIFVKMFIKARDSAVELCTRSISLSGWRIFENIDNWRVVGVTKTTYSSAWTRKQRRIGLIATLTFGRKMVFEKGGVSPENKTVGNRKQLKAEIHISTGNERKVRSVPGLCVSRRSLSLLQRHRELDSSRSATHKLDGKHCNHLQNGHKIRRCVDQVEHLPSKPGLQNSACSE